MLDVKTYTFEEMLDEKGYIVYTNVGASMLPLLRARRDIIEIRPARGRINRYEVALYKRGDKYILHRCLEKLPNGRYVFAGDHNIFKEYDVTDDMILGVMTRVIRDGKSISVTDWKYKVYYHLWCDFYPMRVLILRAKAKLIRTLKQKRRGH